MGGLEIPLETMSTGTELLLKRAQDKAPTVKEICKLDDIAYFGKVSKLREKKDSFEAQQLLVQHPQVLLNILGNFA